MQPPSTWPLGKIICVITLILSLVLLFLGFVLPGAAVHLTLWTLILLALLAFGVVLL